MTKEMSELQLAAIKKAELWIKNAGCDYCIRLPDGELLGNLTPEIDDPKVRIRKYKWDHLNLAAVLAEVVAGELKEIHLPDQSFDDKVAALESLRSTICAHCSKSWGNGSYSSSIKKGYVELYRAE
jgi:hypothetical protein